MSAPSLPDDVTVRPADRDDLDGLRETFARSWATAYDDVLDPDRLREATSDPEEFYPAERFEEKLADDRLRFFVAEVAGDVRGAVTVNWSPENTHGFVPDGDAQVRSLYLHPDHWGRGIGTALVERGTAALPDRIATAWVEALAENDVGTAFYESLGFEPVDGRTIDLMGGEHPTTIYRREP